MKIKMCRNVNGSLDGIHNKMFKKDCIYDTEKELGEKLTKVFLENKFAKEVIEEKNPPVENPKPEEVEEKKEIVPENKMMEKVEENKETEKDREKDEDTEKDEEEDKKKYKKKLNISKASFVKKKKE